MKLTGITAAILLSSSTFVLAHSLGATAEQNSALSNVQRIDALYRGEGKPGDVLHSVSNPDVVFRVTASGSIERRNERFDIVETQRPHSIWRKDYNYRGR
jgi:hypothetical protein